MVRSEEQDEGRGIALKKLSPSQLKQRSRAMTCMFLNGFVERRDLEQYFWTQNTIDKLGEALQLEFGPEAVCCLCTPSLAHTFWTERKEALSLLDIDTRFEYLPKFYYFDLRRPSDTDLASDQEFWRIIVFDPPFFYIPMEILYKAVLHVCDGKIESTKLLVGFLKREETQLLTIFKSFNLRRTNFPLEYQHVKPNKWRNYALYSNIDLKGIKRS